MLIHKMKCNLFDTVTLDLGPFSLVIHLNCCKGFYIDSRHVFFLHEKQEPLYLTKKENYRVEKSLVTEESDKLEDDIFLLILCMEKKKIILPTNF